MPRGRAVNTSIPGSARLILRSAALLLGWFAAAVSPAGAQAPEVTLPSECHDQEVAPVSVVITCADTGFIAQDLLWTNWGADRATATGIASVKTCDPDCATGGREEYPVTLVAEQLRACDDGEPQYTGVIYRFPAESPYPPGSPGAENPTVEFPCPIRPHADPKIKWMRLRLTGHNPRPNRYFVRVHVRLRICAVRGRTKVVFNETKRIGGETFGEHARTLRYRQRSRCQTPRSAGSCAMNSLAWAPTRSPPPPGTRTLSSPRPSRGGRSRSTDRVARATRNGGERPRPYLLISDGNQTGSRPTPPAAGAWTRSTRLDTGRWRRHGGCDAFSVPAKQIIRTRAELSEFWLPWCVDAEAPWRTTWDHDPPAGHPRAAQLRLTDLTKPVIERALAGQPVTMLARGRGPRSSS
jgi:hypothetical protein